MKPSTRPVPRSGSVTSLARHEAAHAVIAIKLGAKVSGIALRFDGTSILGGTTIDGRSHRHLGPFSMGLMLMAGSVADNYFGTERVGIVSAGDCDALRMMGATPLDFRALYLAVRPMIVRHEKAIRRIASALARAGKLNRNELMRLLKKGGANG